MSKKTKTAVKTAKTTARKSHAGAGTAAAKAQAAADQENARLRDQRAASADGQTASERAMAAGGVPKPRKTKKVSGLDAAAAVLKDAGQPMRCKDITDAVLGKGLWTTGGKTPHATIYAAILREIRAKGSEARFRKTDRGLFAFNG